MVVILFFVRPKNTKFLEDIDLLPFSFIKFRSAVPEEMENVSANQRPGPS